MRPAGSEPSPDIARHIIAACGITPSHIGYLASGVQSLVWEVRTGGKRYALRIASPSSPEPPSYEAEFGIRHRLADLGGRVARPVCTNLDVASAIKADWCLDELIEGAPDPHGRLTVDASRDLGETLALLHTLSVEGFGPLRNRRNRLIGSQQDPVEGINSRLAQPWPFAGETLDDHPIAKRSPELLPRLHALERSIRSLLDNPTDTTIVHSDLHARQLPLRAGRLAALLDFGDAIAGPPDWDIGSFAYFHGWKMTDHLLASYSDDADQRRSIRHEAALFGVVIALHHVRRAIVDDQSFRMRGALRYLQGNL